MPKDYAQISRAIVDAVGGLENIEAVTDCMTLLRFVIKDRALVDNAALKTIDGVMEVVNTDSQC